MSYFISSLSNFLEVICEDEALKLSLGEGTALAPPALPAAAKHSPSLNAQVSSELLLPPGGLWKSREAQNLCKTFIKHLNSLCLSKGLFVTASLIRK